jgi:uncharacterized repeat protein (TIGR01451 family)
MKIKLLLFALLILGYHTVKAQLSNTPPIRYPEIDVTPQMQAAKNAVSYPNIVYNIATVPNCTTLNPICTAPGQYYSLVTSANSPGAQQINPGNNYACLGTTPNPIWYYMRIDQAGPILLELRAQSDIDYAIWGPFQSVADAEAACGQYTIPIQCSYSGSNVETPQLQVTVTGEIYVLLITNFANIVQTVTLTQLSGTGRVGCDAFSSISGTAINDLNLNCAEDSLETGLPGIYIQSSYGYSVTDSLGNYSVIADSGSHVISQIIPTYLQALVDTLCVGPYSFNFGYPVTDTNDINFYYDVLECPYLTLDVSSNRRRRCFQNFTDIRYCNEGFADASNVQVFVELPQYVNFVSANYPHTIDTAGNYVFNIGNLAMGQCGTIHIVDSVSCVSGITGTVQCIRAWITPPNSCVEDSTVVNPNDPWDQSSVQVNAQCVADSVIRFTILNTGDPGNGNMDGPTEYRIYIDGLLVYTGYIQINGGDSSIIEIPATGGVVRLECDQRPNHPGNSNPNAIVQGCGDTTTTAPIDDWRPFNAQSPDDADVAIEEDCLPILDSYDPNDKQVSPSGAGVNQIVVPGTELDYTIRFQNTGNDLAYRVIIRDTLESDLDISSLRLGVSSHNYDFYLEGSTNPILVFDYKNINLPDSASNPLGSQGFVKFKISPNPNTPLGTLVENHASIYFDFNDPIVTNTAWVTIDNPATGNPISVTVISAVENNAENLNPIVFPNPTNNILNIRLNDNIGSCRLALYDLNARLLKSEEHNSGFIQLNMSDLPAGIYTLQLTSDKARSVLKVIKQ